MKSFRIIGVVIVCIGVVVIAQAQAGTTSEAADALFKEGKFDEAEKIYTKVLTADAKNHQATVRLGNIALLGNRLDEAQKWLSRALELKPDEQATKLLLAEVYYRRDDF